MPGTRTILCKRFRDGQLWLSVNAKQIKETSISMLSPTFLSIAFRDIGGREYVVP